VLKLYKAAFGGSHPGFCALIDSEKRKNPIKRKKILKLYLTKYIFSYLEKIINYNHTGSFSAYPSIEFD
jgi:hypothetical protein